MFLEDAGLKKEVMVIENCPRKLLEIPRYAPQMQKLKESGFQIVLHRGPINKIGVDIEEVIASIKFWTKNTILVLVGVHKGEQEKVCREIANRENMSDRVLIVTYVPTQKELFEYIAAADVGLILYKIIRASNEYMGPTKLYDYMACGIPVVVPEKMKFVSDIVKDLGIGLSYKDSTSEALGKTIKELLDRSDRIEMSKRARQAHLSNLNYETQFAPLYEKIKNAIEQDTKKLL